MVAIGLFILALSADSMSQIKSLPPRKRYAKKKEAIVSKTRYGNEKVLNKIKEQNEELDEMLSEVLMERSKFFVFDQTYRTRFLSGSVLKGILLNSIVSTNLSSPVVLRVTEGELKDSKILCSGVTANRRVVTTCTKLIFSDSEHEISSVLLNRDGSSGLKGRYFDGMDQYLAAKISQGFIQGIIEGQKDRLVTPLGEMTKATSRNSLLNGLSHSVESSSDVIAAENKAMEPIVYINAGKEVLVYLTERLEI